MLYMTSNNVVVYSFQATKDAEGTYAKFMQSYTSQTAITLTKTNTKKYILNGGYVDLLELLSLPVPHTRSFVSVCHESLCAHFIVANLRFSQTFLNFVGVVLHNVKTEGQNAQFIQVSFTMPTRYRPPGATGPLVPFSSVRVGKGMCLNLHVMQIPTAQMR